MPTQREILGEQLNELARHRSGVDPHIAAMQELLLNGEACLRRDFFQPGHFTASAFILSPDRDALLLIWHAKLQRWLQPGGHIENEDATPLAAARREAAEEVNIQNLLLLHEGIFDIDVHSIPERAKEPQHQHFDLRYLFVAPSLKMKASSDALQARWVPLADLDSVESDASVLRTAARIELSGNEESR